MQDTSTEAIAKQEKMHQYHTALSGNSKLAIFYCCILYNAPYITGVNAETWAEYIEAIGDEAKKRFADGTTDIQIVLKDTQSQRQKWIAEWGRGNARNPYTEADYERLDEIFQNYCSRLQRAGGMDALQDDVLHSCSVMKLQAEKAIVKGDKESVDIATKLNKMIQDNLAAEQLRKKDVPQGEELRIDGVVEQLKRKYGLEGELSKDAVMDIIGQWFTTRKYKMTMDAAEHILMSIINTTRRNNDMPEMTELPDELRIPEEFAHEFAEVPSQREIEAYEYLGLNVPEDDKSSSAQE